MGDDRKQRFTMMTNRLLVLCAALLLAVAGCSRNEPETEIAAPIPFRTDGTLTFQRDGTSLKTINIEIAENDSSRTRGLMQRQELPENSGMLFIFDREEPQSFWMANTPLSLDIIYASADSEIVSIGRYTTPFSTSAVPSRSPARFVIETPAGFADTYGIAESDQVTWQRRSE